jgi:DeoR/GlpR family transcriptional regulator of sugar metabolism
VRLSPDERLGLIEERLHDGGVSVQDLASDLGVSEITIRRDLAALKQQGKVLRVYGGALPKERVAYEFSFKEKEARNRAAKEAIGRRAAELVAPGAAVFLDTGTTTLAVARALRAVRPNVIVTINLCVASEFVGQKEVRVLVPGGELSRLSPDVYGEWTLQTLSDVVVDVAFLGCDSVDPDDAFYAAEPRSAAVSRLMLDNCRKSYLVADASKFGERSMCRIAPLARLTGLVTDTALDATTQRKLEKVKTHVIIVPRKGTST